MNRERKEWSIQVQCFSSVLFGSLPLPSSSSLFLFPLPRPPRPSNLLPASVVGPPQCNSPGHNGQRHIERFWQSGFVFRIVKDGNSCDLPCDTIVKVQGPIDGPIIHLLAVTQRGYFGTAEKKIQKKKQCAVSIDRRRRGSHSSKKKKEKRSNKTTK